MKDPNEPTEAQFEHAVANALVCVYPTYQCIVFGGTFQFEERRYRPDLALVARDMSHWFVIEVELVSHSLEHHVLPQVRAFRYGEPQDDCVDQLSRSLSISSSQAITMLQYVPKATVVIANKRSADWEVALGALDIQLLSVSIFSSPSGLTAYEVDGSLTVNRENLGFATYVAADRSFRMPPTVRLTEGQVMIDDPDGSAAVWMIKQTAENIWITKEMGVLDLPDGAQVQIIRAWDGRISMRRPPKALQPWIL